MNRISSTAVTVALAATLLVATAPAAQARNLAKPRPSASVVTGGWFDVALNWLGGFIVSAPQGQADRGVEKGTFFPIPIPIPPSAVDRVLYRPQRLHFRRRGLAGGCAASPRAHGAGGFSGLSCFREVSDVARSSDR